MTHSVNSYQGLYQIPVWIILALMVLLPGRASGDEISLVATVDKTSLTREDTILLSLTVHGVQNPPSPELPDLTDFRVQQMGTSSSTQIINTVVKNSVSFNYRLLPLKTGKFVIGPAEMKLAGKMYRSDPVTITVEDTPAGRNRENLPAFVETRVSNKRPYVNEQIVYTFKLYRRTEAKNLNLDMPYNETFFRKQDLGNAKRYSQVINGVPHNVHELPVALFPVRPGKVELPPAVLELDLIFQAQNRSRDPFSRFFDDPFFGGGTRAEHKVLTTPAVPIEIRPLPEAGRPKNFSNLVGQFRIKAELSKSSLEVGDTTTLTVTLYGTGNLQDASIELPDLEDRFKIYPDQPSLNQTIHTSRLGGEKVFKFALVPYRQGTLQLPPVAVSYFDPEESRYLTTSSRPLSLTVTPSTTREQLTVVEPQIPGEDQEGGSVKVLARDILPIHTRLSDFKDMGFTPLDRVLFAAGLMFPPVFYILIAGMVRHRQRLKYDTAFFRSHQAYNLAHKKLKTLSATSKPDSREFVMELSQIVREYIGNKLNLHGTAFTSLEAESRLKEKHYEAELASGTRQLLEKYESLAYAPGSKQPNDQLLEETLELLGQLEKEP